MNNNRIKIKSLEEIFIIYRLSINIFKNSLTSTADTKRMRLNAKLFFPVKKL